MPVDTRISARRFDFSRDTFDRTKHRRSVVSLQGRVTVEADSNEQRRIDLHRSDTTTRDVIGPAGVPLGNNGFLITGGGPDLGIGAGWMYVEGILCENENACSLLHQPDLPVTKLADVPGFDPSAKAFAVELRVWERDVTPVDDPSLLEKALGGPDTSGRIETVWQVILKAQSDPNATCATAAVDTVAVHDGMLSARTVPSAAARDCTLPPLAGYQGLENQLYRVEIHQGGPAGTATFKWSRENGSVVTGIVGTTGTLGQTFTVQSVGADQTLGFTDNQWVELTDDSIELAGKVGILAFIQHVDPGKQQITLTAPPAGTIDLAKNAKVRRWDQTDPGQTSGVPTVSGGWVALENGIQVRLESGTFQPGDYWIIPARTAIDEVTGVLDWPSTPQPAQYAERHFALLAVVPFDGTNFGVAHDCRPPFDDLVNLTARKSASCCSVSVGDGKTSFGDFTSIQKAIQALAGGGGEICIQAGTYAENISLVGVKDIRIHGCHRRTLLTGDGSIKPVVTIEDSQRIVLGSLAIATDQAVAIAMDSTATALSQGTGLQAISLEDLDLTVRDATAVSCRNGQDIRIARNHVHVKQLAAALSLTSDIGFSPAIFLQANRAWILENVVHCTGDKPQTTALGGIEIGGGSQHVDLRRNVIEGGNGNGIMLGSITFITKDAATKLATDYTAALVAGKTYAGYTSGIVIDAGGCIQVGGGTPPTGSDGNPLVPVSDGMLLDIRILDNNIRAMGGSGIADLVLPGTQGLSLVAVLAIERNSITGCAMLDRGDTGAANTLLPGRGGIALISSEYVTANDNVIAANGRDFTRSVCGVWTGLSFGLVIDRNQIVDNGPYVDTNQAPEPGPRGGIVLEMALPFVNPFAALPLETGYPAARLHDNIVVSTSGPAVAILAMGTVSVQNNELTSHSRDQPSTKTYPLEAARAVFGGYAAFVWNLAWPVELASFVADYATMARHSLPSPQSDRTFAVAGAPPPISGDTTFNNNEVLLDGPEAEPNLITSAVAILSLGDVSVKGNQSDVSLGRATFLAINAWVLAWSLRLADNRFQETLGHALLSAATWGVMNATTDNQGTHCFFAAGLPALLVNKPNVSLVHAIVPEWCSPWAAAIQPGLEGTGMTM
jgi:hypothetical protein